MAFDQTTRNRLARFVSDTRALLTEEFTRQLQNDYGLDPATGEVTDVARLSHLDDARRETARLLRDTMEHYLASADTATPAKAKKARQDVLDRILREQAFTVLNRLCALRMAEARGLLIESIAKGYQSKGFQLYQRLAGTALSETGAAYRLFLFSVFDEFAVDLAVLFDRFSPQGRLFPREAALLAVLEQVNHPDIDPLWTEDETIGWIYQYFNDPEERKQMRDPKRGGSQAPRNSRELAVRNQFFTPRYVVEFLTDNALGRIWNEMTKGETGLKESCRYLVRRPNEIFLAEGQEIPEPDESTENMSQEELLRQPVHIPHRPLKDPRDIGMLDPACGSMHFGLYAFDLFERVYEEAWEIEATQGPGVFTRSEGIKPLAETYSGKEAFLRDVPRLIIERNIHGIDIDPRAVQIAGLSLWLRAQRSWKGQGVKAQDRPQVQRSNIVCAEPMPGETDMLEEFAEQLQPRVLGQLVRIIFEKMKLAGEAGSLLKIEDEIRDAIADAHKEYQEFILQQKKEKGFLPGMAPERQATLFDFADLPKEEDFWHTAEQRVIDALRDYAETAASETHQRRLFAADAARGFAFIDLCRRQYDLTLMNPPFGLPSTETSKYITENYRGAHHDIYASFVSRTVGLCPYGYIGCITSSSFLLSPRLEDFRRNIILNKLCCVVDFGLGVMDDAMVRSAAYVLGGYPFSVFWGADAKGISVGSERELSSSTLSSLFSAMVSEWFLDLPQARLLIDAPQHVRQMLAEGPYFEPVAGTAREGMKTFGNERFLRLPWEVSGDTIGPDSDWRWMTKGGEFSFFYSEINLVLNWRKDGAELQQINHALNGSTAQVRQASTYWGLAGATYSRRASGFSARALPRGCIFTSNGPAILPQNKTDALYMLGWVNSRPIRALAHLNAGAYDHYTTGALKRLPWKAPSREQVGSLSQYVGNAVSKAKALASKADECSRWFSGLQIGPSLKETADKLGALIAESSRAEISALEVADKVISEVYGFEDLTWACELLSEEPGADDEEEGREGRSQRFSLMSDAETARLLISFLVGVSFGRWSVGKELSDRETEVLQDPFSTPPAIAPATKAPNGKDHAHVHIMAIGEGSAWDLSAAVREKLRDSSHGTDSLESGILHALGIDSLSEYLNSAFFEYHLEKYTANKRQAPIYWPLSTVSGSYTLWLYYHRLTDQTLYTCVNDFVEPKLKQVAEEAARLRSKAARSSTEEKDLERLSNLELELRDFRDELLRIARFWKPNLNDGVQITAAPLWRLFQHKPWQRTLRDAWEKLEAGDYDWAHLALSIWPDRVVRASHKDRSYAIAHDLEDRLWHEVEVEKVGRGGRVTTTTEWQPRDLTEADLKSLVAEAQTR